MKDKNTITVIKEMTIEEVFDQQFGIGTDIFLVDEYLKR